MRSPVLAATTVAALALVTTAPGAAARPLAQETFTDSFVDVVEDFCGEPGLTVQVAGVAEGRVLVTARGPEGLPYYAENVSVELTFTALGEDGEPLGDPVATAVERTRQANLHVTSTDDGRVVQVLATGNFTVYGTDGKAIARNPGQVRFTVLFDDGGTPTDLSDDEFVAELSFDKGSTGRTDDECAVLVPLLLG